MVLSIPPRGTKDMWADRCGGRAGSWGLKRGWPTRIMERWFARSLSAPTPELSFGANGRASNWRKATGMLCRDNRARTFNTTTRRHCALACSGDRGSDDALPLNLVRAKQSDLIRGAVTSPQGRRHLPCVNTPQETRIADRILESVTCLIFYWVQWMHVTAAWCWRDRCRRCVRFGHSPRALIRTLPSRSATPQSTRKR